MVKYQYEFPLDRTGKAGAVKPYRGGKNDFVTPVSNLSGVAEILTNASLKATEAYSQARAGQAWRSSDFESEGLGVCRS